MATPVIMPQMGESIAEGTIVRWLKKLGDTVDRDEPLFEISTDKVDAEIPSPAAGVLTEVRVKEGDTVPVNSVVALIGPPDEAGPVPRAPQSPPAAGAAPSRPSAPAASKRPMPSAPMPATEQAPQPPRPLPQGGGSPVALGASRQPAPAVNATPPVVPEDAPSPLSASPPRAAVAGGGTVSESQAPRSREEARRLKSSPLVRKIAREHHLDLQQIPGSGIGGRVTKHDILSYLEGGAPAPATPSARPIEEPVTQPTDAVEVVPMGVMRRRIAEHMIRSRRTSAHVHSVFEVNFARVEQIRQMKKPEYEATGVKLTYLSFIVKAAADALRTVPVVNASIEGDNIVYRREINIGIAVALEWGLIVPVIKQADEKNLLDVSRAISDLAERARTRQLKPEDVQGGTFTITNPGVFGALFGMPIINQPQVAILGVGAVEKRPVVVDDAIAIRPMAYLTLGYDHRLIDGAVADQFLSLIKKKLENLDPADPS